MFGHNIKQSIFLAELHVDWEIIVLFILDLHILLEFLSSFFDLADLSDNEFISELIGFFFHKSKHD